MYTPFDALTEPLARRIATGLCKVGLAFRSMMWAQTPATGLTPTQSQILALLAARSRLRVSAVADVLGIRQPTVTDSVLALVRKGLVAKSADPEDGRAVVLTLTEDGMAAAAQGADWPDAFLRAVDALDVDEQRALLAALIKMIMTLQANGNIAPARLCVTCRYFRPYVHNDVDTPHHCAFVDAAFGNRHLRLDCAEHAAAADEQAGAAWAAFRQRPATLSPTTTAPAGDGPSRD